MNEGATPTKSVGVWLGFFLVCMILVGGVHSFFQFRIWAEWTLAVPGGQFVWKDGRPIGADFVQFAAVAEAWRSGEIDRLYESLEFQKQLMGRAAGMGRAYPDTLSFNYPPFFCWLLRPMAPMNYLAGLVYWLMLQSTFAGVAIWCWRRELCDDQGDGQRDTRGNRNWSVLTIAFLVSPPVCNNLILGHASFTALAIVSLFFFLINRDRDFLAGLVLSLLFYKPTLGVLFGPIVLLKGRTRILAGIIVGAILLTAASWAVSPQAMAQFPGIGRELLQLASTTDGFYLRHFNLLALVSVAANRTPAQFEIYHWLIWSIPAISLLGMILWAWNGPWRPKTPAFWSSISAAIIGTLVLTPYAYSYDTMLASIAGLYSMKTFPYRPYWHRWVVVGALGGAAFYVAGDKLLLQWLDNYVPIRIQAAPIFLSAWLILECHSAAAFRRSARASR